MTVMECVRNILTGMELTGIVVFLQFILLPLPVDTVIEIIMVVSAQILLAGVLCNKGETIRINKWSS